MAAKNNALTKPVNLSPELEGVVGKGPMTRAQVMEFRDKWNTILTRGIESVQKGTPKDQLLASIKVDDLGGWNMNSFNQPARLDPLYAELQAAAAKKK